MKEVKLIISVNGKEEMIKLAHNPSTRKTERERFSFPDFAGELVTTYKNGKYIYIAMPETKKVERKQVSRKTETTKVTQKKITKSDLNKIRKSDLIDFILSQTE